MILLWEKAFYTQWTHKMKHHVTYVNFITKMINDTTDDIYENLMDKKQDQVNKSCKNLIKILDELVDYEE